MRGNAYEEQRIADSERALRDRVGLEPTDALHERVMSGIGRALGEARAAPIRARPAAADLVGWAAVLIVGLVLSQIAASATAFLKPPSARPPAGSVRAASDLLRHVSPDLTRDEAEHLSLACAWGGQLLPVPVARGSEAFSSRANSRPQMEDVR